MSINTAGNEEQNNYPVYGCTGCETTAGRNGCYLHLTHETSHNPFCLYYPYLNDYKLIEKVTEMVEQETYLVMI
ncbi:hypothetical protein LCGC14_3062770 [marine sediment metagenome]|uniref:Uncharacterized protein n=1 Tax=marine sediment metagenome TaxID=412755 RepID=A0A0F8Z958_9ZZZZ